MPVSTYNPFFEHVHATGLGRPPTSDMRPGARGSASGVLFGPEREGERAHRPPRCREDHLRMKPVVTIMHIRGLATVLRIANQHTVPLNAMLLVRCVRTVHRLQCTCVTLTADFLLCELEASTTVGGDTGP